MKVTNNTSSTLIAFCTHKILGYGEDTAILPGQTKNVVGPYVGEMDGGECFIAIEGEIICQEEPDDDHGFQVIENSPLFLECAENREITVRHHSDTLEQCVLEWRLANEHRTIPSEV